MHNRYFSDATAVSPTCPDLDTATQPRHTDATAARSTTSSGSLPYGIVRLAMGAQPSIGLWSVLLAVLHVLALIYWCRSEHRRGGRL